MKLRTLTSLSNFISFSLIILSLVVGVGCATTQNLSTSERKQQEISDVVEILKTGEFKIKRHVGAENGFIYPGYAKRIYSNMKKAGRDVMFEIKSGKEHVVISPYGNSNSDSTFTLLIRDMYRYTGKEVTHALLELDLETGVVTLTCVDRFGQDYLVYRTHCTLIKSLDD